MKVTVIKVFYDDNGLHRKGDEIEVDKFNAELMEKIQEPKKKETKEK